MVGVVCGIWVCSVVLDRLGVWWCGVINHVLGRDSGVVFSPSYKLLVRPGFLFYSPRFYAASFSVVAVHVYELSSLLFKGQTSPSLLQTCCSRGCYTVFLWFVLQVHDCLEIKGGGDRKK